MNPTVKKIIENDFNCIGRDDIKCSRYNCPLYEMRCDNKRIAVIEYIAWEILALCGFDYFSICECGWNYNQRQILKYYGVIEVNHPKIRSDEIYNKCDELQNELQVKEKKPKPQNSKFYVFNPSGCAPRVQHNTYDSALEEAKRLVTKNVKDKFYVCEIAAEVTADIEIKVSDTRGKNNG